MKISRLQFAHPLNKSATKLLRQMGAVPDPTMSPLVQLLIECLGIDIPDPVRARLYHLDATKVMQQITLVLKAEILVDLTPVEATYLIAEAMGLDELVAEPTPIIKTFPA